ncbi:MAG: arginase [Gemmatimonadales bacterium]|nr:MAG: arginase [Gemmatimonadales bacterium]
MDLGAGRRGVDMGPSALRIAGLTEAIEALGYPVREVGTVTASGPEVASIGEGSARYLSEITEVCREASELVRSALQDGGFPLVLGGDHSLTMGTGAAMADHYHARDESLGLIWVDAHTDMNTPATSPSGNIHGMSMAVLTGSGPEELLGLSAHRPAFDPRHVSVLGARQIDDKEREAVREAGIRVFTISEIDERGLTACVNEAIDRASKGTAGFHVSFDLDVIDPMVAPGVGTPVAGGITYREAHLICEKLSRSGGLRGFELVELNPVLDAGNRTAKVGIGLIESALGKRIL